MWNAKFQWLSASSRHARQFLLGAGLLFCLLSPPIDAWAVTYANVSVPFSWIDATGHNRLNGTSAPYRLNGSAQISGCGSALPVLDDSLSDLIPIGFTFNYGGVAYTNLRISSNGRIQFGDNKFCGSGTAAVGPPQTYPYRYPDASVLASMRIYGADLDPTPLGTGGYTTNCAVGNCYLSYAQIGTAPNRSFVVTWNNVPEWIGTSKAGGNFNLQIILQENGEFIYQYGVNVHGATGTAEIGWQVRQAAPADFDVPGFGLPANNSAIKFYIPRPVAEYRMEQPSWSGAAGELIDSSGNLRAGVRRGAVAPTAAGRVCRGAAIPSNTTLATVDGLQTPVNISTTVGGQGTITFWYKSNAAWNAANSDRQLFDASMPGNNWFFLTKRANGRLRFVITDTGGTARVAEVAANNVTAAGTWRHVAVTWNFNALADAGSDRLRIYVDGVQAVQLAFTTSETVSDSLADLVIGDNRNVDSSAQSGSPKSADGTIDEFRIYNFEAGVGLIQRDMAANDCLGHYAIATTIGSTCQAVQVTVSAHDGAHGLVTMPNNTTMITLTTSTGRGDWSLLSGYGVLTNGAADDGVATYLFNGEYQAVFGYQTSSSGTVNFNVSDGQLVESASEDPDTVIGACSVNFNACELTTPTRCAPTASLFTYARLYTKLAATAFKLDVVALDAGGLLNTSFNNTVAVDLLANTNSVPLAGNNCPASQAAIIPLGNVAYAAGRGPVAGVPVLNNAFTAVSPNYAAYRDVRVRFSCNASNCPPSGLTVCSTDNFAVRPNSFTVTSSMNNAARTGTPKQVAGGDFTLTATAASGYNGSPQIDRRANSPVCSDVAMPYANKVQDHDGLCSDRLYDLSGHNIVSFSAAAPAAGAAIGTFEYHDVGHFRLAPGGVYDDIFSAVDQPGDCVIGSFSTTADASGKLGCNIGNAANTAYFGRFYADHFAVTAGSATHGCVAGSFTYMGQAGIGLTYTIQAQSQTRNLLTTKYVTGYLPVAQMGSVALEALNDGVSAGISGTQMSARVSGWVTPNTNWVGGEQTVTAVPLTFSRPAAVPDGPFSSIIFGAKVSGDLDGAVITTRDMNGQTGAACAGAACTHSSLNGATPASVRFGMLRLNPALGSELLPLSMSAQLLFWNGFSFVPNAADAGCTSLTTARLSFGNWRKSLVAGDTSVTNNAGTVLANVLGFPNSGLGSLRLTRPVANHVGSVDVTANLTAAGLAYLQGNQGGANYNVNPWATATFGVFKGPRQVIHLRENF